VQGRIERDPLGGANNVSLLSEAEFQATFGPQMIRTGPDDVPPFDFWPYFDAIPQADFENVDCTAGQVECAYRDSEASAVVGHRLLNLRREYRLDEDTSGAV